MSADTVANFFALILLGAVLGTVVASLRADGRAAIADGALPLLAAVAVGATAGSLYFSEIAGFSPCELCWMQRIAMYPLAVIGVMAWLRRERWMVPYGLVIAAMGIVVSAYHIQLQAFPDQGTFCDVDNPCTSSPVEALGWMTIPMMAFVSFALLITISVVALSQQTRTPTSEDRHEQSPELWQQERPATATRR
ncbi:MAG: disulfide bond formation protein B [Acidimicrobiales bacterium]|nr:disulfide bond formation protein B [Acidimicrobiales bacterium]